MNFLKRGVSSFVPGLLLMLSPTLPAVELELESGALWFSRNDARIPGDDGTGFDLLDLTGSGPDPYARIQASFDLDGPHLLRVTLAPLAVDGTGMLSRDVAFKGEVFTAGTPVDGSYQFSTYRFTYRWMFHEGERWHWGLGGTALVRDADITLEQSGKRESRSDLGLVPLLHVYGKYQLNPRTALVVDMDGAWSPVGRAVDVAFKAEYSLQNGWYAGGGYRTLEGGADNDDVYNFAWLHFAMLTVGRRF